MELIGSHPLTSLAAPAAGSVVSSDRGWPGTWHQIVVSDEATLAARAVKPGHGLLHGRLGPTVSRVRRVHRLSITSSRPRRRGRADARAPKFHPERPGLLRRFGSKYRCRLILIKLEGGRVAKAAVLKPLFAAPFCPRRLNQPRPKPSDYAGYRTDECLYYGYLDNEASGVSG